METGNVQDWECNISDSQCLKVKRAVGKHIQIWSPSPFPVFCVCVVCACVWTCMWTPKIARLLSQTQTTPKQLVLLAIQYALEVPALLSDTGMTGRPPSPAGTRTLEILLNLQSKHFNHWATPKSPAPKSEFVFLGTTKSWQNNCRDIWGTCEVLLKVLEYWSVVREAEKHVPSSQFQR